MKKRNPITLLEIMIVILLIGLIAGVVGYNLKGTLDKGKKFKNDMGARKIEDILNMEIGQGNATASELVADKTGEKIKACLVKSGLISEKDVDKLMKDGSNEFYKIEKVSYEDAVTVTPR